MKRFVVWSLVFLSVVSVVFADKSSVAKHIAKGEMIIYFPSFDELQDITLSLMKRFYGPNYLQMKNELSYSSKSSYGVDIFSQKSLKAIGVNTKGPVAYVHITDDIGYILISITSKKKFQAYVRDQLGDALPYRFVGNYVLLSANQNRVGQISQKAINDKAFAYSVNKLKFNWEKPIVWIESAYLTKAAAGQKINVPQGFTAVVIDFTKNDILFNAYSGMMDSRQTDFIRNMRAVNSTGKFEMLDHIWGNPALIANIYLNIPKSYQYYKHIDKMNIVGIRGFFAEMAKKYRIYLEKDLINNCDGRFQLVVNEFNTVDKKYDLFGAVGIKNKDIANTLMESFKAATLKSGNRLFSFEIFANQFYHYKSTNYSLYFGVVENDFFFATDKKTLVRLVKNIYEDKDGYLTKMPQFMGDATKNKTKGYYAVVDVQSLFSNIKTSGLRLTSEFLVGIKDIYIYGGPEAGNIAYGWMTSIKINFH